MLYLDGGVACRKHILWVISVGGDVLPKELPYTIPSSFHLTGPQCPGYVTVGTCTSKCLPGPQLHKTYMAFCMPGLSSVPCWHSGSNIKWEMSRMAETGGWWPSGEGQVLTTGFWMPPLISKGQEFLHWKSIVYNSNNLYMGSLSLNNYRLLSS